LKHPAGNRHAFVFGVYPPPPTHIGITDLAGIRKVILGPQQLTGKISRLKDLRTTFSNLSAARLDHDRLILSWLQGQMSQWGCGLLREPI
jgi:hypothetical protein